jgi:RNA polymerase sigma factor (sigma-70 family)
VSAPLSLASVVTEASPPLSPQSVVRLAFLVARRWIPADVAHDVGQETWIKVQRQAESQPGWTESECRAWIRCVASNAARDHLRRERRSPALLDGPLEEPADPTADPARAAEDREQAELGREEARRLLAGLNRDERELLAWRAIEGGSWAGLAARRGEKESTLRSRYTRLCAALRATRKEEPRG